MKKWKDMNSTFIKSCYNNQGESRKDGVKSIEIYGTFHVQYQLYLSWIFFSFYLPLFLSLWLALYA